MPFRLVKEQGWLAALPLHATANICIICARRETGPFLPTLANLGIYGRRERKERRQNNFAESEKDFE
jgi:hypothetical protein